MKIRGTLLGVVFCSCITLLNAQNIQITPSETGAGTYLGKSRPVRDIPEITPEELHLLRQKAMAKQLNKKLRVRDYPFADVAFPKGPDAVWQKTPGKASIRKASLANFEGQSTSSYPPDCNGAAGPNHFMQVINATFAIYNKAGDKLVGPIKLNQLFNGVTGSNCNDGDPIVLYDEQADRWLVTEFSICGTNDLMLMAVSTTNDPTGTWYAYSFDVAGYPDYPKFSVWQDGYYMGDNNTTGNDIYVFERSQMLTGGADPKFVGFNNNWRPGSVDGFMCVPPIDNDGAFAPAGTPGLFIAMTDDAFNAGTPDQLWIYELAVNWTNTTASTFNRVQQVNVAPFDSDFGNNWDNIKQAWTVQELDAIPQVIMNVPQYRNFGTYQTIVCCHSVDVDHTDHAGVRWYELRKTPPATSWVVRQQGTYAPDVHSRWMGSIMLNGNNEIGLGYSISSSVLPPGIRYCGQTQAEYDAGSGILDFPEQTIVEGNLSQTDSERWGDYSQMSVDPSDDQTFWFSSEYVGDASRKTKIGSFRVGPIAPTASFTANDTMPCINNTTVNLTSHTKGQATHYLWTFTPATVTFTGSTSSTSIDPQVIFNAYGDYTVSLTVTGEGGTTTTTKTNYIHVNGANADFSANVTAVVAGNNITFNATSLCDINTWLWDFGAGASPATSSLQSPQTVSYSSTGLKTVSLTINNTTTKTRTDYINVIGPDITMSSSTVAACNGTFYDPGGPADNYGNNQDYSMLFYPGDEGKVLEFVFTSFDIEAQTTCDKDYLKIYDGTSSSAPLINTFCGTNSPGTIRATNDAGALLFVFHSNDILNLSGWEANISCKAIPPANPTALTAYLGSTTQVNLSWTRNTKNNDVLLAWSPDGIFGTPADGTSYSPGEIIPGGGTVLASGSESGFSQSGLTPSTTYYYKAFSYDALTNYSSGITTNAITVLQLSVSPLGINASSLEGSSPINILSNTTWTAVSDQLWCTVIPTGTGNQVITADYTNNLSVNARIAHITITVTGLLPVVVTLSQAGTPLLIVTPSNQDVSDLSGNTTFTVFSNGDWSVSSNQVWCAVNLTGSGNGTITAVYSQNPFLNPRTAIITISTNGLPSVYVTVTQAAATPILIVTPSVKNVNSYAAFADFTVTSNVAWTASADSAWCNVTKSGSGNGTITALYSANPYSKDRSTNISVQASGVTTQVVKLVQGYGTSSVPDDKLNGIDIYPNPTKGLFSIVVDKSKFPIFKVLVTDITGITISSRECKGESEYVFDLSKSPQGTYFAKIKTDKELMVTKVVVIK